MAPTKPTVDPFGEETAAGATAVAAPPVEEGEEQLPSVHGDAPVIEAHPLVPLEVQIKALEQEVAEGNENAKRELEELLARRQEQAQEQPASPLELAENAQEQRSTARPGAGKRLSRKTERTMREVAEPGVEAVTPRREDLDGLGIEEKLDLVLAWMDENAPKLDAVLQAYRNFERERELATELFDYQCVECGTITQAARPEHRMSPDQAVRCPKCFPTKGLTPHDILQFKVA